MTADAQAWAGLQDATRRDKSRRVVRFQGPAYPTQKQWDWLGGLLAVRTRSEVAAFVRFANAYEPGELTRIHFIHAITLAVEGENVYGTAAQLVEMSFDPDYIPETNPGEFQRRMIARRKGKAKGTKRKARTNADLFAPTMGQLETVKKEQTMAVVKTAEEARMERLGYRKHNGRWIKA